MFLNSGFPARRRVVTGLLSFAVTAALILCSTLVFAQLSVTGRWTPLPVGQSPANWDHTPIHMALLRGDANYHSYIMSWYQNPNGSIWLGGLWGWNSPNPDDGCLAYPASTLVKISPQPAAPGAQIFCAGHAALGDGRLLVAGGTDAIGESNGINAVRVFNPQTKTWAADDPMTFPRYYPTNTTLPDGRLLVTEGWQYFHMLAFGGRTTPGLASSAQDKLERLANLETSHWDAPKTNPGVGWPEARAQHSAVVRREPAPVHEDSARVILFGGAGTSGAARADTWTLMRSQWYDNLERYTWTRIVDAPMSRARHGSLVASDNSMYVFGGLDQFGSAQDQVHRLFKNAAGFWQWELKSTSGTNTPGARYGHVIAYDTSPGRNRMIVFGGRGAGGLADNEVYALNFGPTFSDFSWTRLDRVTGSPSPPLAREDHTLLIDLKKYTRNAVPDWTRMILYGGKKTSGPTDEVWMLWVSPTEDKVEWQQVTPTAPNGPPPAARSGHAAAWQLRNTQDRMLVFGGDTGSQSDDGVWILKITDSQAEWIPTGLSGTALAGHTALLDFIPIQAAEPEIYDPNAAAGSRWTRLTSAPQRYQFYPFTFVLPSGNVYMAGPSVDTYRLKLDVTPPVWVSGPGVNIWTWSAAMYRPGKIMKCGGVGTGGYDTARIAFDAADGTTGWVQSSTNLVDRRLLNLTLLPDGNVFASGGQLEPITTKLPFRRPQIWNPDGNFGTGSWSDTLLAADPAARDHHSTAILLPDGRLLTAGISDLDSTSASEVTIYCPPYLFNSSGGLKVRPLISAPDSIPYGGTFQVCVDNPGTAPATSIVCLIKPSAVTHSFNQDQRYVPLSFSSQCNRRTLTVTAPANGNLAPPGDYMLFVVKNDFTPSIAKWVRLGASEPNPPLCIACGNGGVFASTRTASGWESENALLENTRDTGPEPPLQLREAPEVFGDAYELRLHQEGGSASALDQVQLLAVDHPPDVQAFALENGYVLGTATPAHRVVTSGGTDVTAQTTPVGGLFAAGPAETLYVDLAPSSGAGAAAADRVFLLESRRGRGGGGAGIVIQVQDAVAGWKTIRSLSPRFEFSPTTVDAVPSRLRAIFLDRHEVRRVGEVSFAQRQTVAQELPVLSSIHSRLGEMKAATLATDGVTTALSSADTLTVRVGAPPVAAGQVRDWFLQVVGIRLAPPVLARNDGAIGAAGPTWTNDLASPRPNPFLAGVILRFTSAADTRVLIRIYDVAGRVVRTLHDADVTAGPHEVAWDGRDGGGRRVAAGVYFSRMDAGDWHCERKMLHLAQ